MCARSSGPGRRSAMPPTGRSISGTSRATAAATCSSTSIRSGPIRRSISSASTTTCRCRTGATGSSMPTRPRAGPRSTTGPTCRGTSRAAKASTGSMPAPPTAPRRSAPRSPTAPPASRGSSATRICAPGGRTRITTARAGWRAARRRHGRRSPSRSGSPSSAAPPSTGAPTSRTSSSTRSRPRASRRISRGAGATTRSSAPISRRRISGGARPRTTRCPRSTAAGWCMCPNAPPGPGTRGPIRSSRR